MWDEIVLFLADLWRDLKEFVTDIFIFLLDLFLKGIAFIVEQIPVPDFVQSVNINSFLDPGLLWLVSQAGLHHALAMVGAAIVFRILRRIFTLGIW